MNDLLDIAGSSPEVRLLLACARKELRPADRGAVATLLSGPIDWDAVRLRAEWHGLRPLLVRHLEAFVDRVPRDAFVGLWSDAEAIRRANIAKAQELLAILRRLGSAGIQAVPYKGPTLALAAYGDLALREFGDLDLLLPRAEVAPAKRALAACGYLDEYQLVPASEAALLDSASQYHFALRSAVTGTLVELHWKTDRDFPVEACRRVAMLLSPDTLELEGSRVPAMRPEALMALLCIHGSKHRWSSFGWLVDVAELARAHPMLDWVEVGATATALRCRRRVGLGMRLARDLLGAPVPEPSWDGAAVSRLLARDVARGIFHAEGARETPWRALRRDLATFDLPAQRARHVLRTTLAPTLVEWSRWRLPRRAHFLYPALRAARLGAKYLFRTPRGK